MLSWKHFSHRNRLLWVVIHPLVRYCTLNTPTRHFALPTRLSETPVLRIYCSAPSEPFEPFVGHTWRSQQWNCWNSWPFYWNMRSHSFSVLSSKLIARYDGSLGGLPLFVATKASAFSTDFKALKLGMNYCIYAFIAALKATFGFLSSVGAFYP